MDSLSEAERRQVLGEALADQLKVILEYVQEIPSIKRRLDAIENRLSLIDSRLNMHEADLLYLRKKIA